MAAADGSLSMTSDWKGRAMSGSVTLPSTCLPVPPWILMRAARASVPLLDAMGILYGLFLLPVVWMGLFCGLGVRCHRRGRKPPSSRRCPKFVTFGAFSCLNLVRAFRPLTPSSLS